LPIGSFHRRVLWLVGLGMFLDACDIYAAGGVLGALVASGWSSLSLNATFQSTTFLGMLLGTLLAGLVGDRFGRRFAYQSNLLIFGLASLAAAFAPDMQVLIGLRFVMGIGMGAEIVAGYSSVAEFMPRAQRGRYVAMLSVITNASVPAVGFGGAWIIPLIGWRYMFALIGAGALVVWLLRKNMPESPRWLESRGRLDEAEAQLTAIEAEAARDGTLPPVALAPEITPAPGSYAQLFGRDLLGSMVVAVLISVITGVILYGFLSWVPTFLVKQGFAIGHSLWFSAFMSLGAPLGGLLGALLADRAGRVRSLVALSLIEAVFALLYPNVGNGIELIVVGFAVTTCAYALVAIGYALYIPELFPTRLRFRGVSVAAGAGRLSSSGVGFVIVSLFGAFGIGGVAGFLSVSMIILVVAVLLLGRETSHRSLEEIETSTKQDAPMLETSPLAND
jgi:putative MFS transporter